MINILVADDDIYFSRVLVNAINDINENIKIVAITTDGKETLNFLNNNKKIDLVLLDYNLPTMNGLEIVKNIQDSMRKKYENSIIIISGVLNNIEEFKKISLVESFITKSMEFNEIVHRISLVVEEKNKILYRDAILNEMRYLHYNFSHKGTKYIIEGIEIIANNKEEDIINLKKDLYPIIARKYNTTVHNVKCNINLATTSMYYDCDSKRLKNYFSFESDSKPNTKTVIYTILNKIKLY